VDAFFVRGNDVRFAVGVDVGYFELGSYAGVVVDFVRDELNLALLRTAELKPVEDGRLVATGVFALVGEIAFAGDEIFKDVA